MHVIKISSRQYSQDEYMQQLEDVIILGWLISRNEVLQELRHYWIFKDDLVVIGGIIMKDRHIIIPEG